MKQTDVYLEKFEGLERDPSQPGWVFPLRKAGLARFSALGFPTTQEEDWRFTNVSPIARLPFHPLLQVSTTDLNDSVLQQFVFAGLDCFRLVFLDGHFQPGMSRLEGVPAGATVGS